MKTTRLFLCQQLKKKFGGVNYPKQQLLETQLAKHWGYYYTQMIYHSKSNLGTGFSAENKIHVWLLHDKHIFEWSWEMHKLFYVYWQVLSESR